MEGNLGFVLFAVVMVLLLVVRPLVGLWRDRRQHLAGIEAAGRSEALFQSMFPELQPLFHPERVVEYVVSRVRQGAAPVDGILEKPRGFPAAARARVEITPKGERTFLEDEAGVRLAEFLFERRADALGSLRVGPGKLTVKQKVHRTPYVQYWHPEREFEWRSPGDWTFKTPVADRSFDSSDRGTSWSQDSSSSSTARAAAAGAAVAGLGGTFDGGGASAGWDGAVAGSGAASEAGIAAGASGDSGSDANGGSGSDSGSDSGGDSGSTAY